MSIGTTPIRFRYWSGRRIFLRAVVAALGLIETLQGTHTPWVDSVKMAIIEFINYIDVIREVKVLYAIFQELSKKEYQKNTC
jgi:hypothetical protein